MGANMSYSYPRFLTAVPPGASTSPDLLTILKETGALGNVDDVLAVKVYVEAKGELKNGRELRKGMAFWVALNRPQPKAENDDASNSAGATVQCCDILVMVKPRVDLEKFIPKLKKQFEILTKEFEEHGLAVYMNFTASTKGPLGSLNSKLRPRSLTTVKSTVYNSSEPLLLLLNLRSTGVFGEVDDLAAVEKYVNDNDNVDKKGKIRRGTAFWLVCTNTSNNGAVQRCDILVIVNARVTMEDMMTRLDNQLTSLSQESKKTAQIEAFMYLHVKPSPKSFLPSLSSLSTK